MKTKDTTGRVLKMGDAVRAAREAKGMSQEALGLMVGTSQSYIYRLEIGKVNVGIQMLLRIADALDVEVRDLLSF